MVDSWLAPLIAFNIQANHAEWLSLFFEHVRAFARAQTETDINALKTAIHYAHTPIIIIDSEMTDPILPADLVPLVLKESHTSIIIIVGEESDIPAMQQLVAGGASYYFTWADMDRLVFTIAHDVNRRQQHGQNHLIIDALERSLRAITMRVNRAGNLLDYHDSLQVHPELALQPLHDVLEGHPVESIITGIESAITSQRPQHIEYLVGIAPNQTYHLAHITPIINDEAIIILRDITREKRTEQVQSILFDISRATSEYDTLSDLLGFIQIRLGSIFDTKNFYVALYDEVDQVYNFPYGRDEFDDDWSNLPLTGSLTDYVRRTGIAIRVDTETHERMIERNEARMIGAICPVWLGAPLKTKTGVIGVMVIQSYENELAYSEDDLNLFANIAENIAWVIENKRSTVQMWRYAERLQALRAIDEAILTLESPQTIGQTALKHLQRLIPFQWSSIWASDHEGDILLIAEIGDLAISKAVFDYVNHHPLPDWVRQRELIAFENTTRFPEDTLVYLLADYGIHSIISLPLIVQNDLIGRLVLGKNTAGTFDRESQETILELSDQLAVAINNARLYGIVQRQAKTLEQRVGERTQQLQDAIHELEAFAYSVSHDLRAPLRSIDGFSQALLEDYGAILDEQGQDYLHRVRQSSQRMGDLIDDLLMLSRVIRSELHVQEVDLSAVAEEICTRLREDHPERIITIDIESGISVQGDRRLLKIVLENLLENAWKFTMQTHHPQIRLTQQTINDERTFCVSDNGIGFNMAYVDKLFGTFQRLHRINDYSGTGIGLATVKRIVLRHGGQIWAEGVPNEGASFFFTLHTD